MGAFSAPAANTTLFDLQATGAGTTTFSVDAEGDVVANGLTLTGNLILPNAGTIGQAAGPLLTFDDTANELEISGGNVGIGTASPGAKLHVAGDVAVPRTNKLILDQDQTADTYVTQTAGNVLAGC